MGLADKEGFFLFIIYFFLSIPNVYVWSDTITSAIRLKDGDAIVSSGGFFEMGFFSPGTSKNRYIGIWYKNIPVKTVVWVANRETSVADNSGVLKVLNPGVLTIVNDNTVIWSSNTSRTSQNPVVQLLDSGNLVVRDKSDNANFLWQSFDYPGDTLITGMKMGKNLVTGHENYITSFKKRQRSISRRFHMQM